MWYNLEAKYVAQGAYDGRVSLSMELTSAQLDTINKVIEASDSWSELNNCSSFAVKVWNSVSSVKLSNGTIGTPTNLRDSIKSKSGYWTNLNFTQDYKVYYANGTGAPVLSKIYN